LGTVTVTTPPEIVPETRLTVPPWTILSETSPLAFASPAGWTTVIR